MKAVPLVDDKGNFIEDILVDVSVIDNSILEGKGTIIAQLVPSGLYKPRWDFKQSLWIEGMSAEEIEQLKNPASDPEAPETTEQKLHRLEQADLNNKELIATLYEILMAK